MTDDQRIANIIRDRGSDPDIAFLLDRVDVCATLLGNLMEEIDRMNPRPDIYAAYTSHARGLAGFGDALRGFRKEDAGK